MRNETFHLDLADLRADSFETAGTPVEPSAYISIAYSSICTLTADYICGPTKLEVE